MNNPEVIVHDIRSAADRAKVTEGVIRRWIAEGMKAMPVGRVGKRGPRDYRIFDTWLLDYMEARAVRTNLTAPDGLDDSGPEAVSTTPKRSSRRAVRRPAVSTSADDGLWPKP